MFKQKNNRLFLYLGFFLGFIYFMSLAQTFQYFKNLYPEYTVEEIVSVIDDSNPADINNGFEYKDEYLTYNNETTQLLRTIIDNTVIGTIIFWFIIYSLITTIIYPESRINESLFDRLLAFKKVKDFQYRFMKDNLSNLIFGSCIGQFVALISMMYIF
jgi:Fe2+ transport system protein B